MVRVRHQLLFQRRALSLVVLEDSLGVVEARIGVGLRHVVHEDSDVVGPAERTPHRHGMPHLLHLLGGDQTSLLGGKDATVTEKKYSCMFPVILLVWEFANMHWHHINSKNVFHTPIAPKATATIKVDDLLKTPW